MIRFGVILAISAAALLLQLRPVRAWGDEGHRIIATIADSLLRPDVRRRVDAMLRADEDPLTDHDIASEATWADHLRDADADGARRRTRQWHFVDLELTHPSLDEACFGRSPLPPGTPASLGPARACLVDKIEQFAAELAAPGTAPDERLLALKFLLHFVGDLHQPLHAADDDDRGGNDRPVSATGFRAGNLHHYWDIEFVRALGPDPTLTATGLLSHLDQARIASWSKGTPESWAWESFLLAQRDAYGRLPASTRQRGDRLDVAYVEQALADCRLQLARAGVRLAAILNRTLAATPR